MGENDVSHSRTLVKNLPMEMPDSENDTPHSGTGEGPSSKRSRTYSGESNHHKRSTASSNGVLSVTQSSQNKAKSKVDIIDRETVYFPSRARKKSNSWCLYRVNVSSTGGLGFIVPSKLLKVQKFHLYNNREPLEVKVIFLKEIDFQECRQPLEAFTRYLFEEVFHAMNAGAQHDLKFDLEQSPFQLLPCLLTDSNQVDYPHMESIVNRKKEVTDGLVKINDREVYFRSDYDKQYQYFTIAIPQASDGRKNPEYIHLQRFEEPSIDYLKLSNSSANKKQKTQSTKRVSCRIDNLRYAPLNQMDFQLISKVPSILARIVQVHQMGKLRNKFARLGLSNLLLDTDNSPVTFGDCREQMRSLHQANVLSRASPDIGLLSSVNDAVRLTNLIFEATTTPSAQENTHMSILSIYGDSFLKMAVSTAIYPEYVSGEIPKPGAKKDAEVRNSNLRRLASKRGLMSYLNSTKIVFIGGNANWLPPGYTISGEHADRYLKQKIDQKAFGDMIEALIGAFLISTGDATTIRFMNWLGLYVVWNESTVPRMCEINSIYNNELPILFIEKKLNYKFKNKGYLMASTMDGLPFRTTIDYAKLKFIGNPIFEFWITQHILFTGKTSGDISIIRNSFINKDRKAQIMIANELNIEIKHASLNERGSRKLILNVQLDKEFISQSFESLIGAIYIDSDSSIETVSNVLKHLIGNHIDLDLVIQNQVKP